ALSLAVAYMEAVEGDYYRDGKVPEEDRALWSVDFGGRARTISVRLGSGRAPAADDPEATVLGGAGGTCHPAAILKVPRARLPISDLKPGRTIRISSTLIGHARSFRTEWSGEFSLAE